jgi:hypothetical protein
MREIVRFETNIPQIVSLAFDTGKMVEGRFGDQVMYSLEGDNLMYVPPIVADRIDKAGIRKGDQFSVCKAEVKQGNRKSIEWQVLKLEGTGPATPPQAAKPDGGAPKAVTTCAVQSQPTTNGNKVNGGQPIPPSVPFIGTGAGQYLLSALVNTIDICEAAGKYAQAKGLAIQFTSEDIRALAITAFIQHSRENGGRS